MTNTATDYPPLLPLAETPLHGWTLDPGWQWACTRVEQGQLDAKPQYDWRCLSCVRLANASMEREGDRELSWWPNPDPGSEQRVMLSWLIKRSLTLLGANLYPPHYEAPHHCENEHPEPQWAVCVIHITTSDSASNATSLCAGCLVDGFIEQWLGEVEGLDPETYAWEIRPVAPPDACPNHTGKPGPHHDEACHYWDEVLDD